MTLRSATDENPTRKRRYGYKKRYWWLLSLTPPMMPAIMVLLIVATGQPLWAAAHLVLYYLFVPAADAIAGNANHNPSESTLAKLEEDPYFRHVLYLAGILLLASFVVVAWAVGTLAIPLWAKTLLTVSMGISSGAALTIGHELGHKTNRPDQWAAKVVNSLCGYAHFCLEHNRGHHTAVATPGDPASARMGESIYAFAAREIPGAAKRGWLLEKERLSRRGHSVWNWRNDLLQGYAITLAVSAVVVIAFGWWMIVFLLVHNVVAWLQLSQANFVEHYGLLRQKRANGRYEPCEARHSWNNNHIVSNMLLFHLQRHSDHHANPMRPYQTLRNFDDLPQLPSGYPGCFGMLIVPAVWRAVMDPRVVAWADGDLSKVNIAPRWRDHYERKFGSGGTAQPAST